MRTIDPGHVYDLDSLDGVLVQQLIFVKREGPGYPGNVGAHPGTTTQEVLRALIERSQYVNGQIPCSETTLAIGLLQSALYLLESRAARRHGRILDESIDALVSGTGKCVSCGHVGCSGFCRTKTEGVSAVLDIVQFEYVNHRGERATRTVRPIRLYFGSTAYHPQPGWLLEAFCLDRQQTRDFSMAGMVSPWRPRQEQTT